MPSVMGKHLVDIDERALSAARAEMGTATIKETVNRHSVSQLLLVTPV